MSKGDLFLSNDDLRVGLLFHGAELSSIQDDTGREYVWQADPAYWNRHASLLFPIVGRVKDDTYSLYGKEYHLPQHGFARNTDFVLESATRDSATFVLRNDAKTEAVYPCPFVLSVSYKLTGRSLTCTWKVENPSDQPTYFAIGGHPGFNWPQGTFENGFIGFDGAEALAEMVHGRGEAVALNNGRLAVTEDLFNSNALVFDKPAFHAITLYEGDKPFLRLDHTEFPVLALWSPAKAPFVCIEPWFRASGDSVALEEKPDIIKLAPGEIFTTSYNIEIL